MNPTSQKLFSWKKSLLLSLGVGLLAVFLSLFMQTRSSFVDASPTFTVQATSTSTDVQPPAEPSKPTVAGKGSSFVAPSRLIIPAIGVDANIQSVGLWWRDTSVIGIPTNFTDVGWYNGSAVPGKKGTAIIDGHYDGATVQRAVFYDLDKLQPGDVVKVINNNGTVATFKVTSTKIYDYNASTNALFASDDDKAHLYLITCGGDWIRGLGYNKRIVVFSDLVSQA